MIKYTHICVLLTALLLSGCMTASRGSQTYFVVDTLPHGAKVTTDYLVHNKQGAQYYGCAATPCKISMPRRSQFNVMVTKEGYQPFFYVIQKKYHKESKKDKEIRTAVKLTANGEMVTTQDTSSNAGILSSSRGESAAVLAGTATGTAYSGLGVAATVSIMEYGGLGVLGAPLALAVAEPLLITNYGIDLASGSLIDLTPNPMIVNLASETNKAESENQIEAFLKSRKNKRQIQ